MGGPNPREHQAGDQFPRLAAQKELAKRQGAVSQVHHGQAPAVVLDAPVPARESTLQYRHRVWSAVRELVRSRYLANLRLAGAVRRVWLFTPYQMHVRVSSCYRILSLKKAPSTPETSGKSDIGTLTQHSGRRLDARLD